MTKKKFRFLAASIAAVMLIGGTSVMLAACGDSDNDNKDPDTTQTPDDSNNNQQTPDNSNNNQQTPDNSNNNQQTPAAVTVFTTTFDSYGESDYADVFHANSYGEAKGVGMVNLDNWGDKKLTLNDEGHCVGEGLKYTLTLDVSDASAYVLTLAMNLIGNGAADAYTGEGVLSYIFNGSYTVSNGDYVLGEPTSVRVTMTGTLKNNAPTDFANYLPDAPFEMDNTSTLGDDVGIPIKNSFKPEYLIPTIFGGATFQVSGSEISGVYDEVELDLTEYMTATQAL